MKTLGQFFLCLFFALTTTHEGFSQTEYKKPAWLLLHEAAPYSIIISEIMADPSPTVGLPDAEYLELYNRGESTVSLEGYTLTFGNKQKTLSGLSMEPGEFVIVCDADDEHKFTPVAQTLPVQHMPAILNSGQVITLKSSSGQVIHTVEFTREWFSSAGKAEGGWSLEMIDRDNPCGRADNWSESVDPRGGTPGAVNSVNGKNPDCQRPKLYRATLETDSSVVLYFSESMDRVSVTDPFSYYANQGLLHPCRTDPVEPAFSTVRLLFPAPAIPGLVYTVTALNTLTDCVGNTLDANAGADFSIPQKADSFDVVFNEILFDTPAGVSEFIELCNRSEKVIDLSSFSLALCNLVTDSLRKITSLNNNSFILFPQHFVVITRDKTHLPDPHNRLDLSTVIEQPALFTLPDKEGEIALINRDLQVIDRLYYNRAMQSAFLPASEGISLERIYTDQPTNDADNWYSAAYAEGFATPGFENSQKLSPLTDHGNITVNPAVFSPDGDGNDDMAFLIVIPGDMGFIGNIAIYDLQGSKIKTLCANMLLGSETVFSWDGTCNDQSEAPIGIYLIYIEMFNQQGIVKKYRKVVTLARRLLLIN
jgi:hypothetical protein